MFRFRAFRKCWLGASSSNLYQKVKNMPLGSRVRATCVQSVAIAVVSLACIAISPSLYGYYQSKSDLCVLIAIPGLSLTASITAYVPLYSGPSLARSELTFILSTPFAIVN